MKIMAAVTSRMERPIPAKVPTIPEPLLAEQTRKVAI